MSDKSPLQMLAQTCSQIGSDSSQHRISSGSDKTKLTGSSKNNNIKCSSPSSDTLVVSDNTKKVPFKPYENSKDLSVTVKSVDNKRSSETDSNKSVSISPQLSRYSVIQKYLTIVEGWCKKTIVPSVFINVSPSSLYPTIFF